MSRFSRFTIRRTNDGFECKASLQEIAFLGRRFFFLTVSVLHFVTFDWVIYVDGLNPAHVPL